MKLGIYIATEITSKIMGELFEEHSQDDLPMYVPVIKEIDSALVIERYNTVCPRFRVRKDYFTGDWCLINANRADRPKAFKTSQEIIGPDFLHPDMFRYNPKDGARYKGIPPEEILSRLMSDEEFNRRGDIDRQTDSNGRVVCREVLFLHPFLHYHGILTDFCVNDGKWDPEAFLRGLEWTAKRTNQILALEYKPVIFRNHGAEAAASQPTPHQQQGGLPIRINRMRKEVERAREFYKRYEIYLHDAIIAAESEQLERGIRVIKETEHAIALVPFAPTSGTREARILLKQQYNTLDKLFEERTIFNEFGYLIVEIINTLLKSGARSFNYAIFQDNDGHYRLSFAIAPSQKDGGMEKFYDTLVVEELPEVSAQIYREHL